MTDNRGNQISKVNKTRFLFIRCVLLFSNVVGTVGNVAPQQLNSSIGNGSVPIFDDSFINEYSHDGIFWDNLGCRTQAGDVILKPFSGFVANGQVCGILGPCTFPPFFIIVVMVRLT